ncbi:MAG: PilZ domain-containing protein [Deltaproteobacteria bacterium]|nr:MAG: PilZ domain-containing protein [Deltaproteobacteria bacterium]
MSGSRHSERKAVSFPATVRAAGGTFRDAVTNVSLTGLYLQAQAHRMRPGERVEVAFSLPVGGRLVPVKLVGRVARVVKDSVHRVKGIGVEFVRPSPQALATLDAYVAERDRFLKAGGGGGAARETPVDDAAADDGATDDEEIPTLTGFDPPGEGS